MENKNWGQHEILAGDAMDEADFFH